MKTNEFVIATDGTFTCGDKQISLEEFEQLVVKKGGKIEIERNTKATIYKRDGTFEIVDGVHSVKISWNII